MTLAATLVDVMGSDDRVVDAARVSLRKKAAQFAPSQNARLIAYLAKHGHFTPFTHPQATFHINAPIFVARQLFKTKVGMQGEDEQEWDDALSSILTEPPFSENEVSRRYVDDEPEFHEFVWRTRAEGVKQGSGGPALNANRDKMETIYTDAMIAAGTYYDDLLKAGAPPEQARAVLPVATQTEWYWTGSLAAWGRLFRLRTHHAAQEETALILLQIGERLSIEFPLSWKALTEKSQ